MFKLFSVDHNNIEKEIHPENGIYIVYELFEYRFEYNDIIIEKNVFIEDELLDLENKILTITDNSIYIKEKKRIFEDYFGYLKISINKIEFNFEVRIQKLKVLELEEILLYLWNQDPIIFNNFFSKSTLKSKLDKESVNFYYSSKFVNIFEDYYLFFKNSFLTFKSLPHNVLRTKNVINDYEIAHISSSSIDWLINNLDELHIDYLYKNINHSIQIGNSYGVIEKILTEEKIRDYNTYENKIILGSFNYILSEITKLKKLINNVISTNHYYDKDYYSINEFKIIPFLKLKDDLEKIERKIRLLEDKYRNIFIKTVAINAFPKLTPVFSNKRHYTDAFNKIKLIRNIKLNLEGELNLLNIKKLSTLYERFNLYILINSVLDREPISYKFDNPKLEDNTFQEYYFQFHNSKLTIYYDYEINNNINKTGLQRISKTINKKPYRPDYIIKVEEENEIKYYILDSKYSTYNRVKHSHLPNCINKYILDIGISINHLKKAEELILIYPGKNEEVIYGDNLFKPKISIMPSKTQTTNIKMFINSILSH